MNRIEKKLETLPWYVTEYIDNRKRKLSPTTLLNYCHDYIIFFNWLFTEYLVSTSPKDIELATLEKLTVKDIEAFLTFLEYQLGNSKYAINRKLSALKSLFHYLQNIAETSELKPYLNRNVMAKIELNAIQENQEVIANRISGKILRDDEFESFRQFIAYDFGKIHQENKRIYHFYLRNNERDTAIISLILGSGLRLSEVSGANIDDLDLNKNLIRITRKGGKEQYVYFSNQALHDLKNYLNIRESKYLPEKNESQLFMASSVGRKGTSRRLTQRSIEKLVEKYAKSYGKPALNVHSLRHSFATRYHFENNDIPKLKKQLGHASVQTTMIYTHLTDEEMKAAVNNADLLK